MTKSERSYRVNEIKKRLWPKIPGYHGPESRACLIPQVELEFLIKQIEELEEELKKRREKK